MSTNSPPNTKAPPRAARGTTSNGHAGEIGFKAATEHLANGTATDDDLEYIAGLPFDLEGTTDHPTVKAYIKAHPPAKAPKPEPQAEPAPSVSFTDWTDEEWATHGADLHEEEPDANTLLRLRKLETSAHWAEKRLEGYRRGIATIERREGIKPTSGTGSIGTLTAFDLPYNETPPPLVAPFITRDEATILYAKGGTGKGLVACWLITEAIHGGEIAMIFDAEGHKREWSSRLHGMGLTDDELKRVHYRSPSSDDWTAPGAYLGEVHELIKADCDTLNVTLLVIDSYTYAASGNADLGGQEPAREFFDASKRIGRHTVVLAHNTGASKRFPDRPFGSVHVGNGSREMWAIEKVDGEEIEYDHSTNPLQPKIVALELRNTKMSERPKELPQFLTFAFFHDGHIEVTRPERTTATTADLIQEALGSNAMSIPEIIKAIEEDFGEKPSNDTVKKALQRNPKFSAAETGRPRKWSVTQ